MLRPAQSIAATFNAAPGSQSTDRALIESIAEGNKAALELLYLYHGERVRRFVLRLTGMESIADEVVNEVFLSAWRHAGEFKKKSQVATWLLGIARFKAISECRRRRESPLGEHDAAALEDLADNPVVSAEKRQRSDILRACLAKLAPSHREAINLVYYQEQKIEDVSRSTGVPVSTIKTRLHYARSRMAELLTEAGVDRAWIAI